MPFVKSFAAAGNSYFFWGNFRCVVKSCTRRFSKLGFRQQQQRKGQQLSGAIAISTKGIKSETGLTLEELQAGVGGGLVQLIQVSDTVTMWVNEEGLFRDDLELNDVATIFYHALSGQDIPIMGPIVFTGGGDDDGETLPLTDTQFIDFLDSMLERVQPLID